MQRKQCLYITILESILHREQGPYLIMELILWCQTSSQLLIDHYVRLTVNKIKNVRTTYVRINFLIRYWIFRLTSVFPREIFTKEWTKIKVPILVRTRVETRINKLKLRNTQSVFLVLLPLQRSIRHNCNSVVVVHHVINRGIYIYYVEHVIN